MDLQTSSTYLKVNVVHSVMVKYTPQTIVVKKRFWPWDHDETEKVDKWTLEMSYVDLNGKTYVYTNGPSDNHAQLQDQFNLLMQQIKDQDNQFANRLLEDAIINGGTK